MADQLDAAKAEMAADPDKARLLARQARLALPSGTSTRAVRLQLATASWLEAEALTRLGTADAARPLAGAALRIVATEARDSRLHGDILSTHGGIRSVTGDPLGALIDYQAAYRIHARNGHRRGEALALQNIGSIYQDAGDYERVLRYYRQAQEAWPQDELLELSSRNNQGNALDQLGRYGEAVGEYRKALRIAERTGNRAAQARILDNLAQAQLMKGEAAAAEASIGRALRIAAAQRDAGWYPLLLGTAARIELARGRDAAARTHVETALAMAGADAATLPFRDVQHAAYLVFKRSGATTRALHHFEIFSRLDAEGRSLAASSNALLTSARFDFATQNARIATLKAGQLERDIALDRLRARQSILLLGAALVIAVLAAAGLAVYLRTLRRSRNAIQAVNAELRTTNVALQDALEAKQQFLATSSHEIRTPLNGILGMTQLLLADGTVAAGVRERIGLVHQAGMAMRRLVDDLLDSTRGDGDAPRLEEARIDLPALLSGVASFWRDRATGAGLTLELELDACPAAMLGDSARLRQVLDNLVANAIKFTHQGGIRISAGPAGTVDLPRVAIMVADTGIGIAPAEHQRIFDRFYQVDGGLTRQHGGNGLGLAIVRRLIDAMEGSIAVDSDPGSYSRFTVSLPLREVAAVDGEPAARFLLTGFNPLARASIAAMLKASGAPTASCDGPGAARTALGQSSVDACIIDFTALQSDPASLQALAAACQMTGTRLVSIIAADEADVARRLLDGLCDHALLPRPIARQALLTCVLGNAAATEPLTMAERA